MKKDISLFEIYAGGMLLLLIFIGNVYAENCDSLIYDKVQQNIAEGEYYKAKELLLAVTTESRDQCWYVHMSNLYSLLGLHDDNEKIVQEGLLRYGNDERMYYISSHAYIDSGKYDKALIDIEKGLKLSKKKNSSVKKWLLNNKALALFGKGDFPGAKRTFDDLLEQYPDNVSFILNSMSSEAMMGNYNACEKRYEKALSIGVNKYGELVGLHLLARAAYYTNRKYTAIFLLKLLKKVNNGMVNGSISELSFLLNFETNEALNILKDDQSRRDNKSKQILYAGLHALHGRPELINEIIKHSASLSLADKETLSLVLSNLKMKEAAAISKELYQHMPDNLYYNYLYAFSLKNSGESEYKKYLALVMKALPNNKIFQLLEVEEK